MAKSKKAPAAPTKGQPSPAGQPSDERRLRSAGGARTEGAARSAPTSVSPSPTAKREHRERGTQRVPGGEGITRQGGAGLTAFLPSFGPLGRVGFGVLLAALALAPVLGGVPAGSAYEGDPSLGILRLLVLLASLCLLITPPTPNNGGAGAGRAASSAPTSFSPPPLSGERRLRGGKQG